MPNGRLSASRRAEHGAEDGGGNRANPACSVKAWSLHEAAKAERAEYRALLRACREMLACL
jgi:hypothetical protein